MGVLSVLNIIIFLDLSTLIEKNQIKNHQMLSQIMKTKNKKKYENNILSFTPNI